jgi:hypothetical protein
MIHWSSKKETAKSVPSIASKVNNTQTFASQYSMHLLPRFFFFLTFTDKEKERTIEYTRGSTFADAYAILGILTIDSESFLVLVTDVRSVGSIRGAEIFCITGTKFIPFDWQKESFYSQPGVKIPYVVVSVDNKQFYTLSSSFFIIVIVIIVVWGGEGGICLSFCALISLQNQ